ncbi:outer membrane protein, OMP85 family, putative [Synechococcus sp. PCC 7335]|uniref:ShlB/FhaC/HecB family hemolysin secretion/activation protein n=1 Tax=Synechococcus sp. (strain ATCC 29403 / PCC 7335) TaxID=91464 RepID=UPI00017EE4CA|nr:ShlB/FhaC/HecB family hemolysin secretion/activation protein [Synechococcus sp. PCC 7335]EDX82549.1 outer membrane protein, OMP85 family, putative [Synechococcus sp. PCC 7335]
MPSAQHNIGAVVCTGPVVLSLITAANAQVLPLPPNSIDEPLIERELIELPEKQPPVLEVPVLPSAPIQEISPNISTLFVSTVQFVGNTVFTNEQLQAIAQPYTDRFLTYEDLVRLRSDLTNFYVRNGYTFSGVYIPAIGNEFVDPSDATITLQVAEGSIERIVFVGDKRLESYVRERLEFAFTPLNQPRLEAAIRLLQNDPFVQSISANIAPGSAEDRFILEVQAAAQPTLDIRVGTDNQRLPSVGSVQTQAELTASNLLGAGEQVRVSYGRTEGSNTYDVQVGAPVNRWNGTLSFAYASIDGRITEDPIEEFDIRTDSQLYTVSFEQPVIRKVTEDVVETLAVGISATRLNTEATLSGIPFPLSPGANANGTTRVTELSFFQSYLNRTQASALYAGSEFNLGLDAFNATVGSEPDAQYLIWRGQTIWLQRVFNSAQLSLTGALQLSSDPLIPFSQFSLGGPNSIRGYRQDALLADSGASLTAELQVPIVSTQDGQQLSLIPFTGVAVGWNNNRNRALDTNVLSSIGLGGQYEWKDFAARINYAIPFTSIAGTGDSLQEQGIDFEVRYRLRF